MSLISSQKNERQIYSVFYSKFYIIKIKGRKNNKQL